MKLLKSFNIVLLSFMSFICTNAQDEPFLNSKEIRLKTIAPQENNLPLIFMISGDGGWTTFDQRLAESIGKEGFGIVGLDARKYFWSAKTPESTTTDITNIIEYYQKKWNKQPFILIGYSFGADVVPFIANRLKPQLKDYLRGVLALSPDKYSDFKVTILKLLHLENSKKYDVIKEFKNIKQVEPVAFFGSEENLDIRNHFIEKGIKTIVIPGNHHFNYDYEALSKSLFEIINKN